ncbi:MAG: hypothetical protein K4571_18575 [Deltaproteobacteria bacterium]
MLHRNKIITWVLVVIIPMLVLTGSALAEISCSDLQYGNPNYQEKMDELAWRAGLPDKYWNRYHEDVVRDLCGGNVRDIDELVDNGSVRSREVQGIAKILGKTYKPKQRSESGKSYKYARERFSRMGACSACADNIAQYYSKKPDSLCGKLAKQALQGNPEATRKIVDFPDYCQWKY